MINFYLSNKDIIGKHVEILYMKGEPHYKGKKGIVKTIDSSGQIHGTWGGCAIIPGTDQWRILHN